MIPQEQWIESVADLYDDETGELIAKGGDQLCMIAISTKEELSLLRQHYSGLFPTINHGKHPITGNWDATFDTFNICWKTLDANEFRRLGGSPELAISHGYDEHPNYRRPKSVGLVATH